MLKSLLISRWSFPLGLIAGIMLTWMAIFQPYILFALAIGLGMGFIAFKKKADDAPGEPVKKGCLECGSSGRHKRTCSKFQKDKGAKQK
jgi:hypothetical protein